MGNDDTFRQAVEIMVMGGNRGGGVQTTRAVKVAQILLLLGVHTDDRVSRGGITRF